MKKPLNVKMIKRDGLTWVHDLAYSIGHLNNDLILSQWIVLSSWFLTKVVRLTPEDAGLCLLSGELVDAVSTPIIGFYSDKFDSKFGKRMIWYFAGFLIASPAFGLMFFNPPFVTEYEEDGYTIKNEKFRRIWFCVCAGAFSVGWSMGQISHLSIVN